MSNTRSRVDSQLPWVPVRDRLGGDLCKLSQGMANTRVLPSEMWRIISGFCQLSYLDVMPLLEPCLREGRVHRMPPNKQKWLRPFVLEYLSSKFEEGRNYCGECCEWLLFLHFLCLCLALSVSLSLSLSSFLFHSFIPFPVTSLFIIKGSCLLWKCVGPKAICVLCVFLLSVPFSLSLCASPCASLFLV